jgi:hypothetical protein
MGLCGSPRTAARDCLAERTTTVPAFEYQVVYIDYEGRISTEGHETFIANERRTTFVRRHLDTLGAEGWELVGIQPLSPRTAYYVFKRPRGAGGRASATESSTQSESTPHPTEDGAFTAL